MSVGRKAANHAGEFGPEAYTTWRSSSLGTITEDIERRLILHLAGELNGRAVLDVGCGDGALTLVCWQNGASRVVGCDIDPRMIARAVARATQHKATVTYAVSRAETLPFPDRSFDLVTAITVLAFVPEPVLALGEIARVLGLAAVSSLAMSVNGASGPHPDACVVGLAQGCGTRQDSDRRANWGRWYRRQSFASSTFPARSIIPALASSRR